MGRIIKYSFVVFAWVGLAYFAVWIHTRNIDNASYIYSK